MHNAESYNNTVRLRIAPSPTGDPHIGTAYVALFNYLLAKKLGGKFILRLEDTDSSRTMRGSASRLYDSMRWLGLDVDEGPEIGGGYGPYIQSERRAIYDKYKDEILMNGGAYRCFCSKETLDDDRESGIKGYTRRCRALSASESDNRAHAGEPFVIRLRVPIDGECVYEDPLRGETVFLYSEIDDQVLVKSDGMPTYHFANVIDDHLMQISHVVRGEEWLSSLPKHLLLYRFFGWQAPQFFHLPLLMSADGKKLSKRRGNVSIEYYQELGVLPEALLNFLFLLGGGHTEEEIMSIDDMIRMVDPAKFGVSSSRFDMNKLLWVNQMHLKHMADNEVLEALKAWRMSDTILSKICNSAKSRIQTLSDIMKLSSFIFVDAIDVRVLRAVVGRVGATTSLKVLVMFKHIVRLYGAEDSRELLAASKTIAKCIGANHKSEIMPVLFAAITGEERGLPLFNSITILGKAMTIARLQTAAEILCEELERDIINIEPEIIAELNVL